MREAFQSGDASHSLRMCVEHSNLHHRRLLKLSPTSSTRTRASRHSQGTHDSMHLIGSRNLFIESVVLYLRRMAKYQEQGRRRAWGAVLRRILGMHSELESFLNAAPYLDLLPLRLCRAIKRSEQNTVSVARASKKTL